MMEGSRTAYVAGADATGLDSSELRPKPPRGKDFDGRELLKTHRLLIRELRLADVGDLSNLHQEPVVRELLLEPVPIAFLEIAGLIISANHIYKERPGLGIWHASTHAGQFVGLFSLMPVEGTEDVELGARLMPSMFGRMYSLEGTRAIRDYAFLALNLPRLCGFCDPRNRAVPVIFGRLGFSQTDATEHFGRPALRFELSRAQWQRRISNRHSLEDV